MAESAQIAQTLSNNVGASVLWHIAGEERLHTLDLFKSNPFSGFSGRQSLTKDSDLFYNTVQAIVNKTVLTLNEYDNHLKEDPFELITIGFPVIVIDGTLFESYFENEKVELNQVKKSTIHWRGSNKWKFHASVHIVTKDYLSEWISSLNKEFNVIADISKPAIENLVSIFKTRESKLLNHKPAPRGYIGLPNFLNEILKDF